MALPSSIRRDMAGVRAALPEWWPVLVGLLVLYIPTFYGLMVGVWSTEEQAHGPIILCLSLWVLYQKWPLMLERTSGNETAAAGWAVLLLGMCMYILGRSQQILSLEILSFVLTLLSVLLLKRGSRVVAPLWFGFFFMLFMIPLPGQVVSMLTMPMKMAVSYATEHLLYALGFPIARSGVMLQIGQYQLLVADACAGLQTLLTLEALGLLYLNMVRHTEPLRNIGLALLIIPISFSANVIRVIVLSLITYYFGDAVGQGFLHGFAGMVLFVTALTLILSIDMLLQWLVKIRAARSMQKDRVTT